MSRRSAFVEFVTEQMGFVDGLRVRGMFGGHGVYRDDLMFAIIVDERLYLKADHDTRRLFEAKALRPFTYVSRGKPVALSYFEAPPEVFDETDAMREWVDRAFRAAVAAKAGTNRRRR